MQQQAIVAPYSHQQQYFIIDQEPGAIACEMIAEAGAESATHAAGAAAAPGHAGQQPMGSAAAVTAPHQHQQEHGQEQGRPSPAGSQYNAQQQTSSLLSSSSGVDGAATAVASLQQQQQPQQQSTTSNPAAYARLGVRCGTARGVFDVARWVVLVPFADFCVICLQTLSACQVLLK